MGQVLNSQSVYQRNNMGNLYHIPQNSFYIRIDKVRYVGEQYKKCIISYFSKATGKRFAQEKNVKIRHGIMQHWEKWDV